MRISFNAIRRTLTALAICILLKSAIIGNAKSVSPYKHGDLLFESTNRIMGLLNSSTEPTPKQMGNALVEASNSLKLLLDDPYFRDDLKKLAEQKVRESAELTAIKSNFSLFAREFLIQEETALRKAGLNEQTTKELLWAAVFFRDSVGGKFDPELILTSMNKFQVELEAAAKTIEENQAKAESAKEFTKWAYRFGGIALITANTSFSGAAPVVAVISVYVGSEMMGWNE